MSHFLAFLARARFIQRWSLMRLHGPAENVAEHSLMVAYIAHALAVLRNERGGSVSLERVLLLAIYHDVSEIQTGDMPTPVKYANPEMTRAFKEIEHASRKRLYGLLPEHIRPAYEDALFGGDGDEAALVRAADKIAALLYCMSELAAGNSEFSVAARSLRSVVDGLDMVEVGEFMMLFAPSFSLTLDELTEA